MNRRALLTLTSVALLSLGAASNAHADELKFRQVMHATFAQTQDIGDVDGHTAGINRHSGIVSFPDGTVGTTYLIAHTDYTKGASTFTAYNNITLKDGSILWFKSFGTTTVDGTVSNFKGTTTVLGGKGRFDGAKGDGTFSGARLSPLAVGADLYVDFVIDVKK
jgi:hypothetical protein